MSSFRVVKLVDPIQMTISGTFTPKGAYAAGTDYAVGDSVDYNGSSYVMYVDAAAGTLPTDTTKWQVLANKGDTGETATNHALLNNLAYADSGHTGFEPAKGADDNYVTDAEKVVIGNTSGTNTGDQDLSAYQLEPSEGAFVDGDKTKLDGIEALADVTDATNVAAAGAIMDGDITGNGLVTRTGAGAYTNRTITGTANQVTVTNGDGVSGNPTLSLPQNIDTSATPTFSSLTAGTATDVLGTALSVIRNNVAVGRIDNNASGLRVQAQNGSLQLRGTGNTGIAIDASGNAVVAGTITGANLSGTNTGDNATNSQYSGLDAAKVNKAGDTMSGNLNMGTNKLIGGTGVTDVLKLQGTTGNGTAGSAAIQLLTGNNGATTALTVLNSGNVGVGTATPVSPLQVNASHTTYLSEIWLNSGTANSGPYLRLGASSSYPNYIGSQFGAQAWAGLGLIMRDNANQFVAHGGNIRLSTSAQSTKKDVAYTSKVDGTKTFLFTADADIWGTYPGSTFTIGANTYTVKAAASDRIAVLEDISGEAATGTLTGVSYTPTRMNITSTGVVGVNNTDLTSRFSVSTATAADVGQIIRGSSAQTGDLLRFYNSANNTLSVFDSAGKLGIGTATPGAQLQVTAGAATTIGQIIRGASAQTADLLQLQDSSANKLMVVSSGGNVGIGTTSPSDKLHVASAKILSPTLMGLTIQDTTSAALGVGGGFSLYGNYTGTSTTIAGAIDAYKTNATDGNWDFDMRFQTRENSTSGLLEVMRLTANRRVGIGTATPSAILNTSIAGGIEPTLVHASNSSLTLTRNAGSELAFTISANSPFTASLQHRNAASDSSSYPIALNPLGGNVGIGTTSPQTSLEVNGIARSTRAGVATQYLQIVGGDANGTFLQHNASNKDLYIDNIDNSSTYTANAIIFRNGTSGTQERMRVAANGNINIGSANTTPGGQLHVISTAAGNIGQIIRGASSQTADLLQIQNNSGTVLSSISSAGFIGVGVAPTAPLHIKDSRDITTYPTDKGIRLQHSTTGDWLLSLGISGLSNTDFALRDNITSTYPLVVKTTTGNVGIGTTSPGEKLDVSGTVKATGYKSSDGSAGVSGSFTTTDGKTITIKDGLVTSIV